MNKLLKLAPLYTRRFEILAALKKKRGLALAALVAAGIYAAAGVASGYMAPDVALDIVVETLLGVLGS